VEHVVFFPAQDGSPAFRRVASLEEAVRLVEHLRNVEGVSEVSCHALTEVPLAFRAWYRVEVPAADAAVPAQPTESAVPDVPAVEDVEAPAEELEIPALQADVAEPVLSSVNGHGGDGAKSLGFFA
jgi:hypothetical protein